MPSLRQYRDRIVSVKSTRKITSAMKMVAASKLKKAQDQAQASQPYAQSMASMLARVAAGVSGSAGPQLLVGTGSDQRHLVVVVTSDRGLCGGFNANAIRFARAEIRKLLKDGKNVKIICVGRKARDLLRREFSANMLESFVGLGGKKPVTFAEASQVSDLILNQFSSGSFDVCTLIYNNFLSVLTQKPTASQLIPFAVSSQGAANENIKSKDADGASSPYGFEPNEEEILAQLLPKNLAVQIFRALLDSAAGEQAARMTAMDSATRNAGDMIKRLSLQYNRARQAHITKELIEIISGAEAV
jgi:F-type H+-transporting ATPase subunit gamma